MIYFENENLELQKQFEIVEIPNIDNILIVNVKGEQEKKIISKKMILIMISIMI